ncbi:MAG: hypothetical protein Q9181_003689 [Wetmoreana brouardii]
MDIDELHEALDTCALDSAYEKCLHQHETVQGDERFRRLRIQLLVLEDENDHLHTQVADADDYIQRLEHGQNYVRGCVQKLGASLESAQGELRIKSREIETLKAEIGSLHGVTMDSTKLLTEKLAMARELSTLRPELDHLRSQAASNQSLLAEKLSLEHQTRTLQLELENEKRSMQRVLAKDGKARSEEAKFESQLQALQAELNRERHERQKSQRESQDASHTWETHRMTLESRLDSSRTKLRTTKDSLKEVQQELQNARSMAGSRAYECAAPKRGQNVGTNARKRTATQMLSDSMIGTPGDRVDDRRMKRMSTLPGDKSAFSITPYLNRTASAAPESPPEIVRQLHHAPDTAGASDLAQHVTRTARRKVSSVAVEKSPTDGPGTLGSRKNDKGNAKTASSRNKLKPASVLEQVAEEDDDERDDTQGSLSKPMPPTMGGDTTLGGNEAIKRKKRKLLGGGLGKTLFDEDDQETVKPINEKFKIFKPGQTVGYAPGSWSQVAVDRTSPNGRVVGIDVIPAQPPTGVSTIQGNFLSAAVQDEVKRFLQGTRRGKPGHHRQPSDSEEASWTEDELEANAQSYLEQEKQSGGLLLGLAYNTPESASVSGNAEDRREGRLVDVVLSDMSAPWEQTEGFWKRSLSDPYYRMMNTSGINFRDHAGSMDLCDAALRFAFDTLRVGGHFICKFYQGTEDKSLEGRLRALFTKVHREKPESSRNASKEAFFVALKRKAGVRSSDVSG